MPIKYKSKEQIKQYLEEHPNVVIPFIYDVMIRNILKQIPELIVLIINNCEQRNYKVEEIEFLDTKNTKRKLEENRDKDLMIRIKDQIYDIEINNTKESFALKRRNMAYVGDMLTSCEYKIIHQININNHYIYDHSEYLKETLHYKKSKEESTEIIQIHQLSVPKFEEMSYTNNEYDKDFITFMKMLRKEEKQEIQKLVKGSKLLERASKMQERFSKKAFYVNEYAEAKFREEEKEEYRKDAIKQTTIELAKKMIKECLDKTIVSKVTGLPLNEIEKLGKNEMI